MNDPDLKWLLDFVSHGQITFNHKGEREEFEEKKSKLEKKLEIPYWLEQNYKIDDLFKLDLVLLKLPNMESKLKELEEIIQIKTMQEKILAELAECPIELLAETIRQLVKEKKQLKESKLKEVQNSSRLHLMYEEKKKENELLKEVVNAYNESKLNKIVNKLKDWNNLVLGDLPKDHTFNVAELQWKISTEILGDKNYAN